MYLKTVKPPLKPIQKVKDKKKTPNIMYKSGN